MRYLGAAIIFLAGSTAGWMLGLHLGKAVPPVYAQGSNTIDSGCTSFIPESWGSFRGTSTHGFVFEDRQGTIRVIQHPPCGSSGGSPRLDMLIMRR